MQNSLRWVLGTLALAACAVPPAAAQVPQDPALAQRLGADEFGMRSYVLVVLRTGPTRMPDGPARDAMFDGHFANIARLTSEGKLVLAGPFDGVDGWRGLFLFATSSLDEARAWVATDPVIIHGEMVAELHAFYGSAALMQVPEVQRRIQVKTPG